MGGSKVRGWGGKEWCGVHGAGRSGFGWMSKGEIGLGYADV